MTKPNPRNCNNCSSKCAYDCTQLQYTTQHRTVKVETNLYTAIKSEDSEALDSDNHPSYLQTTITAQMLSIDGETAATDKQTCQ